jgi:PIF1-like helicase
MELWSRFEIDLSADFRLHHHPTRASNLALQDIQSYLTSQGSSLSRCGLPDPGQLLQNTEVDVELDYFHPHAVRLRERADNAFTITNSGQKEIFHRVVHQGDAACFFVDGHAGRGKTYLMGSICDRMRSNGDVVCVVGTTALSVIHYERGRTAHSTFGIPVQESDDGLQSRIDVRSRRAELLRQARLIIWEELPMAKKAAVECVDQLLQDTMENDLPLGGKLWRLPSSRPYHPWQLWPDRHF